MRLSETLRELDAVFPDYPLWDILDEQCVAVASHFVPVLELDGDSRFNKRNH
jgi:hypothetical protein